MIIIEKRAVNQLGSREESQLLDYLKATSSPLGLLINFGSLHDLDGSSWLQLISIYDITGIQ